MLLVEVLNVTNHRNFKKQVRKQARKMGSYQTAQQQQVLAAKKREAEAHAVLVEQFRSDGVVQCRRMDRLSARAFAASGLLLVSTEPCPPDVMPRLRVVVDRLIGMASNDPALTNGEWRPIKADEAEELFGPRYNPNEQLSWFVEGRFERKIRWRELSPVRWVPRRPRDQGRNGDE